MARASPGAAGYLFGFVSPICSAIPVDASPTATYPQDVMRDSLVLVRGVGDIGSAIAHRLFREGYRVVIHDDPKPTTSRRGMAFADAVFEGQAILEGIRAVRSDDPEEVRRAAVAHEVIPVSVAPWKPFLLELAPPHRCAGPFAGGRPARRCDHRDQLG